MSHGPVTGIPSVPGVFGPRNMSGKDRVVVLNL